MRCYLWAVFVDAAAGVECAAAAVVGAVFADAAADVPLYDGYLTPLMLLLLYYYFPQNNLCNCCKTMTKCDFVVAGVSAGLDAFAVERKTIALHYSDDPMEWISFASAVSLEFDGLNCFVLLVH